MSLYRSDWFDLWSYGGFRFSWTPNGNEKYVSLQSYISRCNFCSHLQYTTVISNGSKYFAPISTKAFLVSMYLLFKETRSSSLFKMSFKRPKKGQILSYTNVYLAGRKKSLHWTNCCFQISRDIYQSIWLHWGKWAYNSEFHRIMFKSLCITLLALKWRLKLKHMNKWRKKVCGSCLCLQRAL